MSRRIFGLFSRRVAWGRGLASAALKKDMFRMTRRIGGLASASGAAASGHRARA